MSFTDVAEKIKLIFKEIARGEGGYSRDHLTHAGNCIENMKKLANEGLTVLGEWQKQLENQRGIITNLIREAEKTHIVIEKERLRQLFDELDEILHQGATKWTILKDIKEDWLPKAEKVVFRDKKETTTK